MAFASGLGYDVSFPEGNGPYPPTSFDFGIVGVTGGRAFSQNSYLSSEYTWALQGKVLAPEFYMNMEAPIGPTSSNGNSGPYGTCAKNDKVCLSKNYGYNAANAAFTYASSVIGATPLSGSSWWLDIETSNTWWPKASLNQAVITGAMHFFQSNGMGIGIYSSSRAWQTITGGWNAGVPNWISTGAFSATDAQKYCTQPLWSGAHVTFTQYSTQINNVTFDADYACP